MGAYITAIAKSSRLMRGADGILYLIDHRGCRPAQETDPAAKKTISAPKQDVISDDYDAGRMVIEADDYDAGRMVIEADDYDAGRMVIEAGDYDAGRMVIEAKGGEHRLNA